MFAYHSEPHLNYTQLYHTIIFKRSTATLNPTSVQHLQTFVCTRKPCMHSPACTQLSLSDHPVPTTCVCLHDPKRFLLLLSSRVSILIISFHTNEIYIFIYIYRNCNNSIKTFTIRINIFFRMSTGNTKCKTFLSYSSPSRYCKPWAANVSMRATFLYQQIFYSYHWRIYRPYL